MATEKFFVFNEAGTLKRLKGRIVRFLDNEDPSGSDKSAIRTSLEVSPDAAGLVQADVGTDPQNLVLHGHLGDLAYQSADSVAVASAEIETLEVTDKVDGNLGVQNSDPSAYGAGAEDLVVGSGSDSAAGLSIASGSSGAGRIYFAKGTAPTGNAAYRGYVTYNHSTDTMTLGTAGSGRWTINSSGNLVANSTGIDFGSGATLSDYEEGTFTPTIYYQNSSGLTISYTTQTGRYVRVGDLVSVQAYLVWTVTGTPANDNIGVSMPLAPVAARQYLQCTDSQGQSAAAEVTSLPQVAIATSSSLVGNLADNIGAGTHTIIVSGTYQTS